VYQGVINLMHSILSRVKKKSNCPIAGGFVGAKGGNNRKMIFSCDLRVFAQ
jgi:hypothetical protein